MHAVTLLANARLSEDLVRYAPTAEVIVLPAGNPGHVLPTGFGHADELISRARSAGRTFLADRAATLR